MLHVSHHKRSLTHRSKASDSAHCDRFLAMEFFLRKTGRFYIYQAASETSAAFPVTNPKIKTSREQGEMSNVRKPASRCNKSLAACYIEPFIRRARGGSRCVALHDDALDGRHRARIARRNHDADLRSNPRLVDISQTPSLIEAVKELGLSLSEFAIAVHGMEIQNAHRRFRLALLETRARQMPLLAKMGLD